MRAMDRKLVLEDGSEYYGYGFGAGGDRVCEIVFNTSLAGYQEIVSDPSYTDQLVVMTYPLIGNYGITEEDFECKNPSIGALAVCDYNDMPSNFRYTRTLSELLEENGIPAISGIDTRKLTRSIRDFGSRRVLLTTPETTAEQALEILRATPVPHDAVARVSCGKRWYARTANPQFNVVAVDCGIKLNIIRSLNAAGCNVTVVPYDTSAEEIAFLRPDGIFLSNGPGDPEDVTPLIETVRALRGKYPMFGICLGHQLMALAMGGRTVQMKYGHHGANHPVKDLARGTCSVTAQNHCFMVDPEHLPEGAVVSHVNWNDQTVEGVRYTDKNAFSVQFHPEACGGPRETAYLFDDFLAMVKANKEQ